MPLQTLAASCVRLLGWAPRQVLLAGSWCLLGFMQFDLRDFAHVELDCCQPWQGRLTPTSVFLHTSSIGSTQLSSWCAPRRSANVNLPQTQATSLLRHSGNVSIKCVLSNNGTQQNMIHATDSTTMERIPSGKGQNRSWPPQSAPRN